MANPQLTVEIGAKIDGLRAGMAEAAKSVSNFSVDAEGNIVAFGKSISTLERQLRTFQNGLKNTLDPSRIATLNSAIDITKQKLAQTNAIINKNGFSSLTNGSNQAAFALTNLGRVAQDAPFGFIGIQNNLNPLLESFQRLRQETGSNGAALKALAGSLIGAGGIGLALSVVTSALTFYTMWQQKANKETKEGQPVAKSLAETYAELGKEIKTIADAQGFGALASSSDLAKLAQLYSASQDVNIALSDRRKIVKELQDQYPTTFSNFSTEQILAGKAAQAYEQLNKQLLNKAIIQANTENISKAIKPLLALQQNASKTAKQLEEANKVLANPLSGTEALERARKTISQLGSGVFDNINKRTKEGYLSTINEMLKAGNELIKEYGAEIIISEPRAVKAQVEKLKKTITSTLAEDSGATIGGGSIIMPEFDAASFSSRTVKATAEITDALRILRSEYGYTDQDFQNFIGNYGIGIEDLLASTQKFNTGLSEIVNSGISSTLSNLGSSIGNAIASGASVAEAAGMSLLSSLGGVLVQLGELAIATGVGIAAVKTALKSLNPVVAIGAGIALVALGSIFKSKAAAIGGGNSTQQSGSTPIRQFATGGYNLPSGMALVGERGPEFVNLPTGSDVYNNTKTNRILANGNKQSIVLGGEVNISMESLYFALKQTEKNLNR